MAQDQSSHLSTVSTDYDMTKTINFNYVVDKFASFEERKVAM
jgi:hypothetical protein